MSKKRTKTERYERQLAALDLLAQIGTLPPYAESKRIKLKTKLTLLYEGAAKRQMRGLITRELHDRPPMERHEIDRTEPARIKPVKLINWYSKSSRRRYNAVIRGQVPEWADTSRGFYITTFRLPEAPIKSSSSSSGCGRVKKAKRILDQTRSPIYSFQDDD